MTRDMKFFNVYYFCHLANESMGEFSYPRTNWEFTEGHFEVEPEKFPKVSVLRQYCCFLVNRVVYEQANSITAPEMEYILFQNRDFLLRFNEEQAIMFEDSLRKRKYIPECIKRAVLFRDKGCCVFCKKDLAGLYSLLEDNEKHFDHIVSLNEGGINDVCNIQLSCKDCNLKKSDSSKTSTLYQSAY